MVVVAQAVESPLLAPAEAVAVVQVVMARLAPQTAAMEESQLPQQMAQVGRAFQAARSEASTSTLKTAGQVALALALYLSQAQMEGPRFAGALAEAWAGRTAQPLPLLRVVLGDGLESMSAGVVEQWEPVAQHLRLAAMVTTAIALSEAVVAVVVEPRSRHPQTAALEATAVKVAVVAAAVASA